MITILKTALNVANGEPYRRDGVEISRDGTVTLLSRTVNSVELDNHRHLAAGMFLEVGQLTKQQYRNWRSWRETKGLPKGGQRA